MSELLKKYNYFYEAMSVNIFTPIISYNLDGYLFIILKEKIEKHLTFSPVKSSMQKRINSFQLWNLLL